LIDFVGGAGRRVVEDLVWEPRGGPVEVTDPQMVITLLLHPGEQFAISKLEPMLELEGMNEDLLGAVALEGYTTLSDLLAISQAKAKKLAKAIGVQVSVVTGWTLGPHNETTMTEV